MGLKHSVPRGNCLPALSPSLPLNTPLHTHTHTHKYYMIYRESRNVYIYDEVHGRCTIYYSPGVTKRSLRCCPYFPPLKSNFLAKTSQGQRSVERSRVHKCVMELHCFGNRTKRFICRRKRKMGKKRDGTKREAVFEDNKFPA